MRVVVPAYPERTWPALTSPGGVCSVSGHLPGHRVSEDGGRGPHPPRRLLRPEADGSRSGGPDARETLCPPPPPGSYSRHPSQQLPGVVLSHGTVCIPRRFFAPSCCQRSRASLRLAGEGLGSAPGLLLQRRSPEDQHRAAGGEKANSPRHLRVVGRDPQFAACASISEERARRRSLPGAHMHAHGTLEPLSLVAVDAAVCPAGPKVRKSGF